MMRGGVRWRGGATTTSGDDGVVPMFIIGPADRKGRHHRKKRADHKGRHYKKTGQALLALLQRFPKPGQTARVTFFDRRHRVHTLDVFTVPPTLTRTDCRLGSQRRRVFRIEWLTLFPDAGPLAHTSHRLAMNELSSD
jgi:hypothetical protein